ncbi:MAG TPA: molybdopterin cofactor-binding domain-containing protein, partial [Gemmatimonadales bacterium]|nr:molybdopterin cofactor-binding domain-containing protein [Gemmatimonadales bacterium]
LKPRSAYRIVGTSRRNLDHPAIVTGRIRFGLDQRVPGMLYAVVERAPVFGAQVIAVDDKAARAVPGVRDVILIDADRMPFFGDNNPHPANGVAVLADSTWSAMQGRRALKVTWDDRGGTTEGTAVMRVVAQRLITRQDRWSTAIGGDVDKALAGAHRRLVAVYETPLLAHAQMEPMNCLARVANGRCEVWAPTQMPEYVRVAAQRITKLPASAITVHVVRMGGAFGRRFYADYAAEAIALAQSAGRPVQVVWGREDDTRHGFYRPAGYHLLRGGTDRRGRIAAWEHRLFNASRSAFLDQPAPPGQEENPGEVGSWDYPAVPAPAFRIGYSPIASLIPRGQWRSVENSSNVFVIQGFLDELAHLSQRDPLAFRLDLVARATSLTNPKNRYEPDRLERVLRAAGERAGWGRPLPRGWGRGIAACYANQSYVAEVVEVQVEKDRVIPRRVVAAVDAGLVVAPDGAEAQVRGAVVMGLSVALHEEITVTGGKVDQGNFDTYPVMRLPEAPVVEVEFLGTGDMPGGLGEPALPPAAPALVNAIYAATGIRLRRLPIRPADLTGSGR